MSAEPHRIDVHFHLIPPPYVEACRAAGRLPARGAFPAWTPELALATMDRHRIAFAFTSLTQPGVHFGEHALARSLARSVNDYAAGLCQRWPRRFGAFTTVPLPDVDGALAEIAYTLDVLQFDGVCLFASYGDKFLGDPAFDLVMAELNRRAAVAFVHPAMHPSIQAVGLPWPAFMMEYPFDTTRAAVNMIFTRTLERFPRIKFILSHAGGLLPYFAWRLSVSPMIDARMPQLTRAEVMAGVHHFWYDIALSPGPQTMGSLSSVADPAKILYGSDWPFANSRVLDEMDQEMAAPGLVTPAQRAAIDAGNARALFARLAG